MKCSDRWDSMNNDCQVNGNCAASSLMVWAYFKHQLTKPHQNHKKQCFKFLSPLYEWRSSQACELHGSALESFSIQLIWRSRSSQVILKYRIFSLNFKIFFKIPETAKMTSFCRLGSCGKLCRVKQFWRRARVSVTNPVSQALDALPWRAGAGASRQPKLPVLFRHEAIRGHC